jgi:lipid-A-disaccharide synthase-like uncharacterized protein
MSDRHLDDPTCPRGGHWLIPVVFLLLVGGALCAGETTTYEHAGHRWEGRGYMNFVLYEGFVVVTGWKILGWIGAGMFAGRWFVQAYHRKRHGDGPLPTAFWLMSLTGAGMTTMYFIWGKNDSVGILQNALPATIAAWNLWQDLRRPRVPA